uniref:MYND-type domain-containing protein n=1 Tax=Tetradesmus obliquus TaxID=3088 RepID=A0A383V915_TETOB|eukprot:jgi/Sobl393_1/11049/SZX62067.1
MAAAPRTGAVPIAAVNSVGKAGGLSGLLSFGLFLHATGSYGPSILLAGAVMLCGAATIHISHFQPWRCCIQGSGWHAKVMVTQSTWGISQCAAQPAPVTSCCCSCDELPLLLTAVELSQLQPARSEAVLPAAMQFIVSSINRQCQQLMPNSAESITAGQGIPATAAAVADGLAAPVLLQLAPAVMRYLREEPAAPAAGIRAHRAAAEPDKVDDVDLGYLMLLLVVLRHSSHASLLGAFRHNQQAVEAALEAGVRLAATIPAWQHSGGPIVLPEVFNYMQHVGASHAALQGLAAQREASHVVGWQPSLLLTCLKAAARHLKSGTVPRLVVLQSATHIAVHAGIHAASSSSTAAADSDRAQLLLSAMALHLAAATLLQLHAPPAAPVPAAALLRQVDAALASIAPEVLRGLVACVACIGCLLPQAAAGGSSSSAGGTPQHIQDLHQLQQRVRQQLEVGVAPALLNMNSFRQALNGAGGLTALVKELFPAALASQLLQLATVVCTQAVPPGPLCCANPGCTNCAKLTEGELVAGKGTVCSGCRAVRLCSAECNKAYWKAGHKQACSRLNDAAGQQQQQQRQGGGATAASSSSQAGSSSSSRSAAGSSFSFKF